MNNMCFFYAALFGLTIVASCFQVSDSLGQDQVVAELPEEIRLDKLDFESLPSVADKFKKKDSRNVSWFTRPDGEKWLQRITFIDFGDKLANVKGEKTLDIPPDIVRIARFFSDLRIVGGIASEMQLNLINPEGKKVDWQILSGHFWGKELKTTYTKTDWLVGKDSGLLKPWTVTKNNKPNYEGYKLVVKGNGTLKSIYLLEEKGVKPQYDITAYTVLGGDLPWIDNVKIDVDATINLSVNGHNKLDEDKFKRFHMNGGPISLLGGDATVNTLDKAYHKAATEYGFLPGRGAAHFTHLEDHYGLKEDKKRAGFTDYSMFETKYLPNEELKRKWDALFPTIGSDYMLTTDGWPKWQKYDPENMTNRQVGAPALDKFDAAGELVGKFLEAVDRRFDGYAPKYLEIKNESTISLEWPYLHEDEAKGWKHLAEFHNEVADQVKKLLPETQVGGPSSAFMYLESNNFTEAKRQLQFMDDTKGKLDFYTHHFYESGHLTSYGQDNNPDGFLAGRLEAVLGLLNNHMALTGNIKPIYLTEIGSYKNGATFLDYAKKLRTHNGYMLRFINATDSIGMLVPYLYPIINWKPDSPDTFFKYNSDQSDIAGTMPMIHHLEMWKDYRGAFLPIGSSNERVVSNAVRHGNKIFIAMQNMNLQRAKIDLRLETGDAKITAAKRMQTYLELGKLVHKEVEVDDLSAIPMRVEEFTIVEVTLDKTPGFESTHRRVTHYGDKVLEPTGNKSVKIKITADQANPVKSILRVGFGKNKTGFKTKLQVAINGKKFEKDLDYTDKQGNVFTFAEFAVEPNHIKKNNTVYVKIADEDGFVSNVSLINDYVAKKPRGASTKKLAELIFDMRKRGGEFFPSNVRTNPDRFPLRSKALESYNFVIRRAQSVADDPIATESEIEDAILELNKIKEVATSW